jgi:hypothetical protein
MQKGVKKMDFTCKAQYTGIGHFVRCLESKPSKCSFAERVGSTFFCKSPHLTHFYSKENITVQENTTVNNKKEPIRVIS